MRNKVQAFSNKKIYAALFAIGLIVSPAQTLASSSTHLDVEYDLKILGVQLGRVGLAARVKNNNYSIAIRAFTDGVMDKLLKFTIETRARGVYNGYKINSTEYMTAYSNKRITRKVVVKYPNKSRVTVDSTPPYFRYPDTVALRDKDLYNVVDPLGAMLLPVNKKYKASAAQQCNRDQAIFDGVTRYKLKMSATKNTRKNDVKLKGAIACIVRYTPISGHRKGQGDRTIIDNFATAKVWILPVKNTNIIIPILVEIPTQFGSFVIEAKHIKLNGKAYNN